ncbi:MAG TPA: MarR family winged helix-turn-helix transcriptional regulator [Chthoniobacterales bacterium]|jgi:MarR family 2-MHQ and catechol resistance regulon transcriptional repressor|nr:MarR family winged helix-turn-helix transcriptional regulator [Chthoniobacterales bacterium]
MPTDTRGVHIWLVMMKAFHAVNPYAARSFQSHGLGDSDFRVLEALLHKGPLPVNTIGPKVFLTPGSISIAVDRLYEKGLVTRMESGTDRRVRVVDLTPKGRELITTIFSVHAEDMEKLAQILKPTERVQLVNALKRLGKHAAESAADNSLHRLTEPVQPGKSQAEQTSPRLLRSGTPRRTIRR